MKRFLAALTCRRCGRRPEAVWIERPVPITQYGTPQTESLRVK